MEGRRHIAGVGILRGGAPAAATVAQAARQRETLTHLSELGTFPEGWRAEAITPVILC